MLIAAKYEERYPPDCLSMSQMTDCAFRKPEIARMEMTVLNTLDFQVACVTPIQFLKRIVMETDLDSTVVSMATYLLFLSLLDPKVLTFLPSV
jgi:hypothetical protein